MRAGLDDREHSARTLNELCSKYKCPFLIRSASHEFADEIHVVYELINSEFVHAKRFRLDKNPDDFEHVAIPTEYAGLFAVLPNDPNDLSGGLDNENSVLALKDKLQMKQRSGNFLVQSSLDCYYLESNDEDQAISKSDCVIEPYNFVRIGKDIIPVVYNLESGNLSEMILNLLCCQMRRASTIPVQDYALEVITVDGRMFYLSLNNPKPIDLIPVGSYGSVDTHKLHTIVNISASFSVPTRTQLFLPGDCYPNHPDYTSGTFEIRSTLSETVVCLYHIETASSELVPISSNQKYVYYMNYDQAASIIHFSTVERRCNREIRKYKHTIRPMSIYESPFNLQQQQQLTNNNINSYTPSPVLRPRIFRQTTLDSPSPKLDVPPSLRTARLAFKNHPSGPGNEQEDDQDNEEESFDALEQAWQIK